MRVLVPMTLVLFVVACGVNTEPILGTVDGGGGPGGHDAGAGGEPALNQDATIEGPDAAVQRDDPDAADDVWDEGDGSAPEMLVPDAAQRVADSAPPPPPDAAPGRDTSCDDGDDTLCDALPPECEAFEVAAAVDGCWACVNAITCRPWGEPGCATHADCGPEAVCNECATGSCPFCEDCVPGCTPHDCDTEPEPACDEERPACVEEEISVVRGGCWVCVSAETCEPGVACVDDHECGLPGCLQVAEVCVRTTPVCADERCDAAVVEHANQYCRDGECGRCEPGDEVRWTCPGGQTVPWCRCDAGGILCIDEPSAACAED